MGPRLTVSVQTVPRSTLGAAGLSRETPTVAATNTDNSDARPNDLAAAFLTFKFWACDIHRKGYGMHGANRAIPQG